MRRALIIVLAGVSLLVVLPSSVRHDTVAGPDAFRARLTDQVTGPTDPSAAIRFQVALRLRQRQIHEFLARVTDPTSSNFGRFLNAASFGRRFGGTVATIRHVRAVLEHAGFRVGNAGPQRTSLSVVGTVRRVERFLNTSFIDRIDPYGRRYHAPSTDVAVPRALSPAAVAIAGLDDRPIDPPTAVLRQEQGISSSRLGPVEIAKAFDITPLWDEGFRGQGETVAVYSADSFFDTDVKQFDNNMGITDAPPVERVSVGSKLEAHSGDSVLFEVNLDIDTIRSVAPRAQILNYEVSGGASSYGLVAHQVVADGRAHILSISYGPCDNTSMLSSHDRTYDENEFAAAEAVGVNIFASTGDSGAFECQRFFPNDLNPRTGYPGDSAYAVAVGGTRLTLDTSGNYLREAGWEQVISQLGGGGGLNPQDPKPEWQVGPGVDNNESNGNRQVPDVAGPADQYSGFYIFSDGKPETGDGTSQATPFWAATMALIQEYAAQHGVSSLPHIAQVFYQLAANDQPYVPFHDVTVGGNRLYRATPGWDYATGLGSPDVYNLTRDVTAYRLKHPA